MKEKRAFMLILLLAVCLVVPGFGQQGRGRGRIRGTVTDGSGNPLAGVKVSAEHLTYGTKFESKTNKKGKWAIGGMGSGYFRVLAELEGYEPFAVEVQVSQFSQNNEPVNIVLKKILVRQETQPVQDDAAALLLGEGNRLFEAGEFEEAAAKFKELLETHPELYQVQINLGNCYKEMGEYERALSAYSALLERAKEGKDSLQGDENAAHALAAMGEVCILKGDMESARQYLQQAVDVFPGDESVVFKVGEIFFNQGEAARGIEYYDRAIAINPEWAPPYRQRGYAYLNLGDYRMALESFRKFLELAPDDPRSPEIKKLIPQIEGMIKGPVG